MALSDDLKLYVKDTHRGVWSTRDGQNVPDADDLKLSNDAVKIEGTVLYADLAESTALVKGYKKDFAAEIYKNYLYCAGKIIRLRGGTITAFDGDRIMAVFIGDGKNSAAARCALNINWAVINILRPATKEQYPKASYVLKQKVGIDTSDLFVARTGFRGSNDLVWVGNAANNAAKMAALSTSYPAYISADVYGSLNEESKYANDPRRDMWTSLGTNDLGSHIYGSTFHWGF
jgi:class 3 adenylate cyclase